MTSSPTARARFGWTVPNDELFAFHLARVRELGSHLCGRRLYETMLPWETDPSLRANELASEFADVWSALPKVVFSHTLDNVLGNARLAQASLARRSPLRSPRLTRMSRSAVLVLQPPPSSSVSSTSCARSAVRSSLVVARRSCLRSPMRSSSISLSRGCSDHA
jgi:hypothetical protein